MTNTKTEVSVKTFKDIYQNWQTIHELAFNGTPGQVEQLLQSNPDSLHAVATVNVDMSSEIIQGLVQVDPRYISHSDFYSSLLLETVKPLVDLYSSFTQKKEMPAHIGITPLHVAVIANQLDIARFLITKGADANACDALGYTPLHYAAIGGIERYEMLVQICRISNVNQRSFNIAKVCEIFGATQDNGNTFMGEKTAIHFSTKFGIEYTVDYLHKLGAGLDATDSFGNSVLHIAAEFNHETLKYILTSSMNVNASNQSGDSALARSVKTGNHRCAALLMQAGADTSELRRIEKDVRLSPPMRKIFDLQRITKLGCTEIRQEDTDRFLECLNCTKFHDSHISATAVSLMMQNSNIDLFEKLSRDKGLELTLSENDMLFSPIIQLIKFFGYPGLLSKIETCAKSNQSHYILGSYYLEVGDEVKMLEHFEKIALPQVPEKSSIFTHQLIVARARAYHARGEYDTALASLENLAIKLEVSESILKIKIFEKLERYSDALKLVDEVLQWDYRATEVIQLGFKLAALSNTTQKISDYAQCLQRAERHRSGQKKKWPLHRFVESPSHQDVDNLDDLGALIASIGVNTPDDDGNTALHIATQVGCSEYVQCLVNKGADVKIKNNKGDTALHIAIRCHHDAITFILINSVIGIQNNLKSFCDFVNIKNNVGDSPLFVAVDFKSAVLQTLIAYLLEFPSNAFSMCNAEGNNFLHVLVRSGISHVLEQFLNATAVSDRNKHELLAMQNADGETPLCLALRMYLSDISCLLLSYGAKLSYKSLSYLLQTRNHYLIPAALPLLEVSAVEITDDFKFSLFLSAIELCQEQVFTRLFDVIKESGMLLSLVSTKFEGDEYLCHVVSRCESIVIFRMVMDAYISVKRNDLLTRQNGSGVTPLDISASCHHAEHVCYLLQDLDLQYSGALTTRPSGFSPQVLCLFHHKSWTLFAKQLIQIFQASAKHLSNRAPKMKADFLEALPKITSVMIREVEQDQKLRDLVFSSSRDCIIAMAKSLALNLKERIWRSFHHDKSIKYEIRYEEYDVEQLKLLISKEISSLVSVWTKKTDVSIVDDSHLYAIRLTCNEAHEMKFRGFDLAFKEAMHYLFCVNSALLKGEVARAPDQFDTATDFFKSVTPTLMAFLPTGSGPAPNMSLASSLVNVFFDVVKSTKDGYRKKQAENIVNAFKGTSGGPDIGTFDLLSTFFKSRFKAGIKTYSVSISTYGTLRLSEDDGVVVFARALTGRIGKFIMSGKLDTKNDSTIPLVSSVQALCRSISNGFKVISGNVQDVYEGQKMPIVTRCALATWLSYTSMDMLVSTDIESGDGPVKWSAHNLMCKTAIIDPEEPGLLWYRGGKDQYLENLPPICASKEEINLRGYDQSRILLDQSEVDVPGKFVLK